jgi:hypothetical protein
VVRLCRVASPFLLACRLAPFQRIPALPPTSKHLDLSTIPIVFQPSHRRISPTSLPSTCFATILLTPLTGHDLHIDLLHSRFFY